MPTEINHRHLAYLQNLDRLMVGIYNEGDNYTRFDKLLPSERPSYFPPTTGMETPPNHPQVKCLEFLKAEGLLEIRNNKYSLTTKGIMKAFGNSFEEEYRSQIAQNALNKTLQKTTILRNRWSLILSIIAIGISIANAGIFLALNWSKK